MVWQNRQKKDREKRRQYDAVYHLRNRKKRNDYARDYAQRPEQKLLRQLYARWRFSIKGRKKPEDEQFDSPSLSVRIILLKEKERGCNICGSVGRLTQGKYSKYTDLAREKRFTRCKEKIFVY